MPSAQSKLLFEHYMEFQKREERKVTLREFARYLDIHEVTLNLIINDKRPMSRQMAAHLGQKTGDNRFYDLKNMPHPDPLYGYVVSEWKHLSKEEQKAVRDQVAEYRTKKK